MGYFAIGPTMWLCTSMAPAGMSASGPAPKAREAIRLAAALKPSEPNSRLVIRIDSSPLMRSCEAVELRRVVHEDHLARRLVRVPGLEHLQVTRVVDIRKRRHLVRLLA